MVDEIEAFSQEDIPTRKTKNKIYRDEREKKKEERKEYIPLVSPKKTTEVIAINRPTKKEIETIEKLPKKRILRKNKKEYKKNSLKLKTTKLYGDSTLIITEKPQAASKIAAALSSGRARQIKAEQGVYYYEFQKNNNNVIVACAVGHLFSLSQDIKGSNYPIFEISWHPNFEVRKKDFTRKYYRTILKLVKRAREIVIATDYDIEGEVIGYNIVRFIANQNDAKRMKYSSLTVDELQHAFNNLHETIDWSQAIAGETRHYLDWFYGINLSRALMSAIKSTGKFRIMSIGRVQGPALKLIVDKEKAIKAFKPEKFYKVFLDIYEKANPSNKLEVKYIKDIKNKKELDKFKNLKDKEANVKTSKSKNEMFPPVPFDLTTLQTEVYKFYSITPSRTLQIAQQLYLNGLISYPRTSSQKIPDSIDTKRILDRLTPNFPEIKLITKAKPFEGKKSDPAHPSIHPTGDFQILSGEEKKVYELIVRRFIALFCDNAIMENKIITAEVDNLIFKARGLEIRKRGWMEIYKVKLDERELKDMNGKAVIANVKIQEDVTKPPKRYSPASIIRELEKRGLGTKATRASIIETLYSRNYISDNKSIKATALGINIIESLEKHSPIIIDEELTRNIEKDIEKMQEEKKKQELINHQETVLNKSKKSLKEISLNFQKQEKEIGKELAASLEKAWKAEAKENELNFQCPKCKEGNLIIKYSPKNKRSFIACSSYPKCTQTYSLPPNGNIKQTDKKCEKCGFPIMMSLRKGKKPWFFCFNQMNHKEDKEKKE